MATRVFGEMPYLPSPMSTLARGDDAEGGAPHAGAAGLRIALPDDAPAYAARLYAALHYLDDAACDAIVVEAVPDDPAWAAVRDRLRRASA